MERRVSELQAAKVLNLVAGKLKQTPEHRDCLALDLRISLLSPLR
jgi:hypothetical protein